MNYLIRDIPEGPASAFNESFSESPESLGFFENELHVTSNVDGKFSLWREREILMFSGDFSTTVNLQCCRCLVLVEQPLHNAMELRCFPTSDPLVDLSPTGEVFPDDTVYSYLGDSVNLKPIIREQVVLSVPPYIYCRPHCKGLCVKCGQDLNIDLCACFTIQTDPRFEKLGSLKRRLG